MKDISKVGLIVQARLNSQRVPNKMIKQLGNSSLFGVLCEKLRKSQYIPQENIFVSVYEEELIDIANQNNMNIFKRSKESAFFDGDGSVSIMYDWWDKLPYKYVVMVSGCNPFLKLETIESFFNKYMFSEHDGMFSVVEKNNYFWNTKGEMLNQWPKGQDLLNTKAVETTYEAGHCLYGSKMSDIGEGKWVGSWTKKDDPVLFPISEFESFDIDEQWQFDLVESYYAKKD